MIRYATKDDVPRIHQLIKDLAEYEKAPLEAKATLEQIEESLFSQHPVAYCHVAEDNGLVVDYRARRPIMELREGVNTKLVWSTPEISLGQDINGKDVLLLTGPEPDTRWHLFAETVADISIDFGVRRMIGIGAYPFATPHTGAVYISCTSPDKELVANLPYIKSSVG